jgi:S1-C subfamily serine protease
MTEPFESWVPTPPPAPEPPPPPFRPRRRHRGSALVAAVVIAAGVLTIGRAAQSGRTVALTDTRGAQAPITTPIKGVVDVTTVLGYQNASAAGTGLVLTSTGIILTNNHVIAGSTSVRVTDVATGRSYRASIVGYDVGQDLAVLSLRDATGLVTAPLGTSSSLTVGDLVSAIGNAGGVGGTPSVVTGAITALGQPITAGDGNGGASERLTGLIQTSAPLKPGDSGGPLVNTSGRVVGIDTAMAAGLTSQSGDSEGFAIPIDRARSISDQIRAGRASSTIHLGTAGFLGVDVSSSGQSGRSGAVITGIEPGTPADQAGLAQGDVIVSVDGTSVDSASALTALMQRHHAGDDVRVGWSDPSGEMFSATLHLISGPAA